MGTPELETMLKNAENEPLLRDTFQFLAGLAPCPARFWQISILHHISLAVRSVIDVGAWADCAALVAEATASALPATCYVHGGPGSRIDVVLANRISKHAPCDVGLVDATGTPTHLPVAADFQFAEYEKTATTIDLNFKDPELEAEELAADRVVAHILAKQDTVWSWAMQQHNVQRLWELWCESAETCSSERRRGSAH